MNRENAGYRRPSGQKKMNEAHMRGRGEPYLLTRTYRDVTVTSCPQEVHPMYLMTLYVNGTSSE